MSNAAVSSVGSDSCDGRRSWLSIFSCSMLVRDLLCPLGPRAVTERCHHHHAWAKVYYIMCIYDVSMYVSSAGAPNVQPKPSNPANQMMIKSAATTGGCVTEEPPSIHKSISSHFQTHKSKRHHSASKPLINQCKILDGEKEKKTAAGLLQPAVAENCLPMLILCSAAIAAADKEDTVRHQG